MTIQTRIILGVVLSAFILVGVFAVQRDGGSDPGTAVGDLQATSFDGLPDLVAALNTGGLQCKRPVVSTPEQTELVGAEFGLCFVRGQKANIHVYEDPSRVSGHIASNVSVRGDFPSYFTSLVHGHNWVVDTYDVDLSRKIQRVLGGTIR